MASPVDLALTAYEPVPPPPISARSNRPFPRSAVVASAADACTCGGGSPTATSRSLRDGPSPSWVSLNASVEGLGTPAPSLQLSAPYSPSLEVTVQPPPMTARAAGGPLSSSPCLSTNGSRDGAVSRRALRSLRGTPQRGGLTRSDSLLTAGDVTVVFDAPSPLPTRDGATFLFAAPLATTLPKASTGAEHLREDQQPALPQRLYQTPLAFFIDDTSSPHDGAPVPSSSSGVLHATPSISSMEFAAGGVPRTWGCARGPQLMGCTTASSSSCEVAFVAEVERPASALRTAALAPAPPSVPPLPPSSSAGALTPHDGTSRCDSTPNNGPSSSGSNGNSCNVAAAGGAPRRRVFHGSSFVVPTPPSSEETGEQVSLTDGAEKSAREQPARVACPPVAPAAVVATATSAPPALHRPPSSSSTPSSMTLFRRRREAAAGKKGEACQSGGSGVLKNAELAA